MFGMEISETVRLGMGIALIFIGFLGLIIPLFIYRISVIVAGMKKTLDAIYEMVKNHIDENTIIELNDLVEKS